MEILKKIRIGSSVFFEGFDDYKSKDTDYLCFVKSRVIQKNKPLRIEISGDDLIMYHPDTNKEYFIKETLETKIPMKAGKFIVPEFLEYFGIRIDELYQFKDIFNNMDDKHTYEKIIYEAYLENGNFKLTNEQLENAYKEYKKKRKNTVDKTNQRKVKI